MVFFLLPVLIAVPILVAAVVFSLVLFVTPPAARPKSTLATSNSTLTVTVTGIGNIGGSKTVTAAYWGTPLPQSKSSSASSQPRFHSITKATVVFTEGVAKKELSSSTLSASPTSPSISPSTAPKAVTTTSIATHVTSAIAKVNSSSSSTDDRKHDQEEDDPKEPENRVSDDIGGLEDEFKDNHVKLHKKELHSDGSGFSGDDEGVGMNLEKRKINDATAEDKRHKKSSKSSDGQRDIAKLERWINKVTDQQSTRYRDNLYTVFNNVLTSKEASRYEKVFKDLALHQSQRQGQRELVQEQFPPLTTFDSHSNRNIMLDLLDPLLQPFILQMRADIRNIFIWLCTGSPGSKIDGQMHGSDEFSLKAVQNDFLTVSHLDGSHPLTDIIDPGIAGMVLDCLKARSKDFAAQLEALIWQRLGQIKEFLLQQLQALTGIPRILIPFSEPGNEKERLLADVQSQPKKDDRVLLVTPGVPNNAADDDGAEKRSEAVSWIVDSVMDEVRALAEDKASKFKAQRERQQRKQQRKSSRTGSRQRGTAAQKQKQRRQLPFERDGSGEVDKTEHEMRCGRFLDRLG